MQDYHAEFVEIYNKNITRPGADRLLNWLETTDFFTAPASTRFHGACECGLVMHSINVYNAMMQHFFTEGESAESYAICGLLHDLCKIYIFPCCTKLTILPSEFDIYSTSEFAIPSESAFE